MKKSYVLLISLMIVAVISVSGCITFENTNDNKSVLINLNESDVQEITTVNEIKNINKEKTPVKPIDGILSPEEIKKAYEDMFDYTNASVAVTGPYKMDNGTYYYIVTVREQYDDVISILTLEVDAKVKPELIDAQGFEAKGVLSEYFYTLEKDDGTLPEAKISEKEITKKANQMYREFGENSTVYDVTLFSTKDNVVVYVVNLGDYVFDANTGELLYTWFNQGDASLSKEKCMELAQEKLDELNITGAYLSEPRTEVEMGGFLYAFDVLYDNSDGSTVTLGEIFVDPFSLNVLMPNEIQIPEQVDSTDVVDISDSNDGAEINHENESSEESSD